MTCTFYTFGLMGLALVTVYVRDWFHLSLVTSVPFLLYFLYIFIMPESPRWLLAKGKLEEALKILETMARVNGKEFPESFHSKLEERVKQEKLRTIKKKTRNIGALDLCKWVVVIYFMLDSNNNNRSNWFVSCDPLTFHIINYHHGYL